MGWRSCGRRAEEYAPYVLIITYNLLLAVFIVLLESLLSDDSVSGPVFVFYEHLLSTFLLSFLALLFEREKMLPITFPIFCWAFLLGFLMITLGQLLLTSSLQYISATFQSTALNTLTAVVFVLAVVFRQETFQFSTLNGQAKLWGILLSAFGATVMLLWTGPKLGAPSSLTGFSAFAKQFIGGIMVSTSILAIASWNLLVERVARKYPADISLAALMVFCGTVQTGIVAAFTERHASSWKISFHHSFQLLAILYGGLIVTGLANYLQIWCIRKRGPVFTTAFSPLLIIFSFLLETLILKKIAYLGSIVGAVMVVVGLYILLWAKADDNKKMKMGEGQSINSPLICASEQSNNSFS